MFIYYLFMLSPYDKSMFIIFEIACIYLSLFCIISKGCSDKILSIEKIVKVDVT